MSNKERSTPPDLDIKHAADHLDLIPLIAGWHFEEWGHLDPSGSLATWTENLYRRTSPDSIPSLYIAFLGGKPVGTASLVMHDMQTRRDHSPWLSGLYVHTGFRRRGVGKALVKHAMGAAKQLGVAVLYLYTRGARPFYERLGWIEVGREHYEGREVKIMSVDLRT